MTAVTLNRVKAFNDHDFAHVAIDLLIAIAAEFNFEVTAYVFMPDHVHFVIAAIEEGADFKAMVKKFKQKTGFEYCMATGSGKRVISTASCGMATIRYPCVGICSRIPSGRGW